MYILSSVREEASKTRENCLSSSFDGRSKGKQRLADCNNEEKYGGASAIQRGTHL